jgi:hypothetical protein
MHSSIVVCGVTTISGADSDLPDGALLVGTPLERHAAEVAPLGDDPGDLAALDHEQRSDVRLDHLLHGLEDRGVRLDLEDVGAFLVEDLRQLIHPASFPAGAAPRRRPRGSGRAGGRRERHARRAPVGGAPRPAHHPPQRGGDPRALLTETIHAHLLTASKRD